MNYRFLSDLFVHNSTAFVTTEGITYTLPGTITGQFGDLLAIDLTDPAHPALAGVLSNTEGPPNGGDTIQHQAVAITDQLAYVLGSTSTGGNTQVGVGQLQVVDTSDPTHLSVVKHLAIPGMVHAVAIAMQGNRALVVGSTGGRKSPFNGLSDNGLTGTVALAVVDITDPANPQLVGNTLVTDSPVGSLGAVALGNGKFAVSGVTVNGTPALMVVDTSGSTQPVVSTVAVPTAVNNMAVVGDDLYTTSSAGLSIYRIETLTSIPVTAEVQVPKNTGVTVVPNSFNIAPTQVLDGPNFQTLVWNLTVGPGDTSQAITWQSTVSNLLPDEVRQLTLNTTVQYVGQTDDGHLDAAAPGRGWGARDPDHSDPRASCRPRRPGDRKRSRGRGAARQHRSGRPVQRPQHRAHQPGAEPDERRLQEPDAGEPRQPHRAALQRRLPQRFHR